MRVYLGSENALVAQHLLDHTKVRTVLYQMGGKTVTESVGRDFFIDARILGRLLYHIEHRHPAERLAEAVDESKVVVCRSRRLGPLGNPFLEGIQ